MKKTIFKLSLLLITFLTLSSCGGDDDGTNNNAAVGQLVATIDGNGFSTVNASVVISFGGTIITAIDQNTNEQIVITLREEATQGSTFNLAEQGVDPVGTGSYNVNTKNAYLSLGEGGSGTVTFDLLDEENGIASGTFSFVGTRESFQEDGSILLETVSITNGAFNSIPFQTSFTGNTNNSFEANVDGVAFNPNAVLAINQAFMGETNTNISAINNATNTIMGLRFPSDITVGTYELSGGFNSEYQGSYTTNAGSGTDAGVFISESGTLTITNINNSQGLVEGTFNFVASPFIPDGSNASFEITNGSFSVEL